MFVVVDASIWVARLVSEDIFYTPHNVSVGIECD